nr:integrase, catalytic region, zinc finger, CCHC-type, peptidase aspartic, catalytic [Tanacetum cinerariifolium]
MILAFDWDDRSLIVATWVLWLVYTARNRWPQPKGNTRNDMVQNDFIPNEDLSDDTTPKADESLDKKKSLELEIKWLLKASVSHDIMSIVQNGFVDVPSDLKTELDHMKEKLEHCIIKKEKEYAVLWNNCYTKCEECKYDKISYDKAYNDMQQKVERLQAQLGDLKGKSSDTPSASNTLDPLNQKLAIKIVELEFQVVNYEREINHLKTTYKNMSDSITSNWAYAKLHNLIYENDKLRARLFKNTSESMNNTSWTSVTSQVDKPKLIVVTPYSNKLHALIPSHSVPQPREFNVVKHCNVIAPGMFKIDPSQTSRVVQICLWCVDSGCSKHMTENIKLLINFMWKFLGTIRFGNDHIAAILGYGDLKWGILQSPGFTSLKHIDRDTYSASAEDIEVQSYFFDDQLTSLSPTRNCIPQMCSCANQGNQHDPNLKKQLTASDTLIDFQIKFSISIGETVTHWFTLIVLYALRRSDNENTLSLMNLILRSILTDLQVTPTKPGRMTKPYSSHSFIANCFNAGNIKMEVKEELVHQRLRKTLTHVLELLSWIYLDDRA